MPMFAVEVGSPLGPAHRVPSVAIPGAAPVEVRGRRQITTLGRREERARVLAEAIMVCAALLHSGH